MSGGSKTQTVGWRYYMGLHMGLCHGPVDAITEIRVGDRTAWTGEQTASGAIAIDAPDLFGGEEREGGVQGTLDVMMGEPSQAPNSYLVSKLGALVPAFRGLLSTVFRQGYVGANNPYVKPWAFKTRRILQGWHGGSAWYPAKAAIVLAAQSSSVQSQAAFAIFAGADENNAFPYLYTMPSYQPTAATVTEDVASFAPYGVDGNNRAAILDSSPSFDFAQGEDFAIEFEVNAAGSNGGIGSQPANFLFCRTEVNSTTGTGNYTMLRKWSFSENSSIVSFSAPDIAGLVSCPATFGAWTSYRVERNGTTLRMYKNGALVGSNTCTAGAISGPCRIGINGPYQYGVGDIPNTWGANVGVTSYRNLRIFKGSITPPIIGMNPAHIVYQCLTDPEWGMGYSASIIDDVSFRAAADTFFDEGMGLCLHWARQEQIEAFLQVVLDHAGAQLVQDRRTGLFKLTPIRANYSLASLPVYDESSVRSVDTYQRPGLAGAVNAITVKFNDVATGRRGSVTVHNLANIAAQEETAAQAKAYPGLPTAALALRVAMRDLQAASTPLAKVRMRVNRTAYAALPGDVIRLTWPKLGIADLVLRVLRVDIGQLTDGLIEIEAGEDVFGLPAATYGAQQPSGWVPPNQTPRPMAARLAREATYYEVQRGLSPADLAALPSDAGYVVAAGVRGGPDAIDYSMRTRTGSGAFSEAARGAFVPSGLLSAALTPGAAAATLTGVVDGDLIAAGAYAQIGPEIVRVDSFDAGTGAIAFGRGVMGTVARQHASGTRAFFLGDLIADDETQRLDGEVVDVKLLTRTSLGELAEGSAPTDSVVIDSLAARPYPPGRVRINGAAYPATALAPITIAWSHRNRLQQNLEGDESGNIGPEPGVTYAVEVRKADTGDLLDRTEGIAGTSYSVPAVAGNFPLRVQLWAMRSDPDALALRSAFEVTRALPSLGSSSVIWRFLIPAGGHVDVQRFYTTTAGIYHQVRRYSSQGVLEDTAYAFMVSGAALDPSNSRLAVGIYSLPASLQQTASKVRVYDLTAAGLSTSVDITPDFPPPSGTEIIGVAAAAGSIYAVNYDGTRLIRYNAAGAEQARVDATLFRQFDCDGTELIFPAASGFQSRNPLTLAAISTVNFAPGATRTGQLRLVGGEVVFIGNPQSGGNSTLYRYSMAGARIASYSAVPFSGSGAGCDLQAFGPYLSAGDSGTPAVFDRLGGWASVPTAGAAAAMESAQRHDFTTQHLGISVMTAAASLAAGAASGNVALDPLFSSVALLLHLNGANGSTSFPDSGPLNRTVTGSGGAQISTAQSRFGGASASFNGSTGQLDTNLAGTAFGTSDFCVECWIWPDSAGIGDFRNILGNGAGLGQFTFHLNSNSPPQLRVYLSGGVTQLNGGTVSANSWSHVAFTRHGNTFSMFLNGTLVAAHTQSGVNLNAADAVGVAGPYGGLPRWIGYIDEVRVTIGAARYTSTFAAPTAPFPDF